MLRKLPEPASLIRTVLDTPKYRQKGKDFQPLHKEAHGLYRAKDVIKNVLIAVRVPDEAISHQ